MQLVISHPSSAQHIQAVYGYHHMSSISLKMLSPALDSFERGLGVTRVAV
jgi:hypothetical protein